MNTTDRCHLRPCQSPIVAYCQEPAAHIAMVEGGLYMEPAERDLCEDCMARGIGDNWAEPVQPI